MKPAMKRLRNSALILAMAAAMTSCAPMTKTLVELKRDILEPACFETEDVASYELQSDNMLEVRTHQTGNYMVSLADQCPQIRTATQLGFGNLIGNRVCGALGETIYIQDGGRCSIDRVMKKSETAMAEG